MTMHYVLAFLASIVGGHFVTNLAVTAMHRTVIPYRDKSWFLPPRERFFYHLWMGGIERAITTTLFIWTPTQVALFIGGWTALKLAAAWSRRTSDGDHTLGHLLALMGSAISFSIAIAAGVWAHPASLTLINSPK